MSRSEWKFLFILLFVAGAVHADQVTLKNGDRVTGAIVKKDGDVLTVKSEFMGVVNIPWNQVDEIKSGAPLNVVVADRSVQATLNSGNGRLPLPGGQPVALSSIVAIRNDAEQTAHERQQHPGLRQLWTGTATLGLEGTKGNAETTTLNVALNAARKTKHDGMTIYFDAVKSSASIDEVTSNTAQAVRGGWSYDRKLRARMEINTFNAYEYDRFQDLDLRFVVGGGPGYEAWNDERGTLTLQSGIAYNHESFSPAAPEQAFAHRSADAYWGNAFDYELNSSTSIEQTFRMFNNLAGTGEYRMNFDLTSNTKLRKWLVWNLSLSDRYLSTPVAGRKANDVVYTTGVGVTFGH